MQSVTVGMTRSDLLKVFEGEGGISTRQQRTFRSLDCPFFKVDVEFRPVGPADTGLLKNEGSADLILSISRPYLAPNAP
jgi:hypothetical protein